MQDLEERVDLDEAGRVRRRYSVRGEVLHGEWSAWAEDGWLAQRGHFLDGLLDGELVQLDPEGRVQASLPYRAGKLDGEALFYDSGRLQMKSTYRNGVQDGESVLFGEDGQPKMRSLFQGGLRHGLATWYRPDGSLLRTAEYVDGELDGEVIEHDEKGRAVDRVLYRQGRPMGPGDPTV